VTLQRVVVDSSGWIEVFTGGGQAEHFLALIADERSLVLTAITIFEVFKWVLREHGEAQAIQALASMQCAQGRRPAQTHKPIPPKTMGTHSAAEV
jgi:uncharacterized protein with PIN domain